MRRLFPHGLLTLVFFASLTPSGYANTYYIAANGSDSNNGTSKTTPWLHAPGMQGCSGTCASITPQPGDSFVLRRGDSWTISSTWVWAWGGNSSSGISIGATDAGWGSGNFASLDGGGEPCGSAASGFPGKTSQFFLTLGGSSQYLEISYLEFTGFYWAGGAASNGEIGYIEKSVTTNRHIQIDHNYFHCWTHAPGAAEDGDAFAITCIDSGAQDSTTQIFLNAFDGADTGQDSFGGVQGPGCSSVYENYFAYLDTAMGGYFQTAHDNTFFHTSVTPFSGAGSHNNEYESNTDPLNSTVYNNLFVHTGAGGVGMWSAPQSGSTTYWFNNVRVDGMNGTNDRMCAYALSNSGGTCEAFNNTTECGMDSGPSDTCLRMNANGGSSPGAGILINEHWITSASAPAVSVDPGAPTPSQANTVLQTLGAANTQGYTSSQAYPFSPTSAAGATVAVGTNQTSLCTTIARVDSLAGGACQNDTTLGVFYDSSTHLVGWPFRTPNARPSSGPWDVGAYFLGGVNPPTALQAIVQ